MKKTLLLFTFLIATAWCSIQAQINIPDANFKAYLVGDPAINTNGDSEISQAEAQAFSGELLINGLSISDLTGIEEFINITRLDCYNNNLTSLDVSNNTNLTRLHCADNQITQLDVSNIPSLNQVHCQNNQLVELNLANGNNDNFIYMKSYNNPNLTCIQKDAGFTPPADAGIYNQGWTKGSSAIYSDDCAASNQIVNIPDANFKSYLLADVAINTNNDSEISVAEAQAFTGTISATGLGITDLTGIEAFVNITILEVYTNSLTSLDVSNNTSLTRLHCADNQITTLDVSNIPTLDQVHCQNNQLVELNLANGNNANFSYMKSYGNPNLTCIQHDASFTPPFSNAGQYDNGWTKDANSSYSSNCSYEPVYVDVNASGANNGSSWADAFTTIDAALTAAGPNSEIWVAKGVYKPSAQNTPIEINHTISLFGGFNGTETELSDRDLSVINTTNATVITGDMNGDDVDGDFTSNKSDNADKLILVDATNITIDGFILENIYDTSSNGFYEDSGVIYSKQLGASTWIENLSIKNTVFTNNYSNDFLIKGNGFKDNFNLYNVSFTNNVSVGQSIILLRTNEYNDIYANLTNVLFADNETKFSVINAYRTPDNNSIQNFRYLDLTITNASFINNNVVNVNNTSYGQSIIMGSDKTRGHLEINNSIFFGNTLNGTYADRDISYGTQGNHYELVINNSITQITNNGGASGSYFTPSFNNVQDLDPNTVSLNLSADYKPTSSSSYIIDQGDNAYYDVALFGDLDLAGNTRFFNTTIDLGAYEYDSTLGIDAVSLNTNSVTLYPNPVSDRLFIKSTETIKAVTIYNVNGQLIKQVNTLGESIDVTSLPSGLYFVKINTVNGETTKKIIKN